MSQYVNSFYITVNIFSASVDIWQYLPG